MANIGNFGFDNNYQNRNNPFEEFLNKETVKNSLNEIFLDYSRKNICTDPKAFKMYIESKQDLFHNLKTTHIKKDFVEKEKTMENPKFVS